MLDADELLPTIAEASKNFHLHCIRPHQTRRCRAERCDPLFRSETAIQLRENRHGGRVGANHLIV